MKKFLLYYIKSYIKQISIFSFCCIVFLVVFNLYNIEVEAVYYAFILCVLFVICCAIPHFIAIYNKYKNLNKLIQNGIIIQKDTLPLTDNFIELTYQQIIKSLEEEKKKLAFDYDVKSSDIIDYYTLWAHQIKTPISAMRLLLQSDESGKNRELQLELFKIEQYVQMVLSYLRIESDTNDLVIKTYNLDDIIKQTVKKFSKEFILNKISLNYTETGINVITDEKWIAIVLEQIISNSLKYTKTGSVTINATNNILYIKDTGIGISKEDLPRVFEKGYTGYNGRIDKKSTGLGLYLTKRIMDMLSHKISITSEEGKGTTVCIDFARYNFKAE